MPELLRELFQLPEESQRKIPNWRGYRLVAPFPNHFFKSRKPEIYIYHILYKLSAGVVLFLIGLGWLSLLLGIRFPFGVASIDLTGTQYVTEFTRSIVKIYYLLGLAPILFYGLALGRFNIGPGYDFFWHIEDMSCKNNPTAEIKRKYIRYIKATWLAPVLFLATPPLLPFSLTFLFSSALMETPFALALASLVAFILLSPLPQTLCQYVFLYRSILIFLKKHERD